MFKNETLKCRHKTASEAQKHVERMIKARPELKAWVEGTIAYFTVRTWRND